MGLLDDAIKEHLELKRRRGADAVEISRLESEALGPVRRSAAGVPDLSDTFEPPHDEPSDGGGGEPAAATTPPASPPQDDEAADVRGALPQTPAYEPPPVPAHEPPPTAPPHAIEPPPIPSLPAYEPPPPEPPPVIVPPTREAWTQDDPDPDPAPEPHADPDPDPEPTGLFSRLRARRHKHDPEPEPEPRPQAENPAPRVPESPAADAHAADDEPDIVPADEEPEDLLEETPEFLEETPEHDRLWFEQRPPRDFNFDD
jgi:hypothetical protein